VNAKMLAVYQGTAIISSTFTMNNYEFEGSQHLYPVSLDDPACQYVASYYPVSSRSHWIVELHIGCSHYPAMVVSHGSWMNTGQGDSSHTHPVLSIKMHFQASDSAWKCMLLCITGNQVKVTRCLFWTLLPDHFTVDNTENEAYFVHVVHTIQFSAAV
jgi:hypothetical protein